jgi:hypothetical protein
LPSSIPIAMQVAVVSAFFGEPSTFSINGKYHMNYVHKYFMLLHSSFPNLKIVIYTGDVDRTPEQILEKVCMFSKIIQRSASWFNFQYIQIKFVHNLTTFFNLYSRLTPALASRSVQIVFSSSICKTVGFWRQKIILDSPYLAKWSPDWLLALRLFADIRPNGIENNMLLFDI